MNRIPGQTVRPSYGRVHVSEMKRCLDDMENETEVDVSRHPENADSSSGAHMVDVSNKENRVDYAHQILASCDYDRSARKLVYGPARFTTASSQAYHPKSVLLPSKLFTKPEDILHGPSSTTEVTVSAVATTTTAVATVSHAYISLKPHQSVQPVEEALRNLSLNPRPMERTRLDVAARTSHSSSLAEELRVMQTPYSQKPVSYSRVPVSYQKPDFDDDDDDNAGQEKNIQDEEMPLDFQDSCSGFVEPTSTASKRPRVDDGITTKNPSTSINFSELMASLDFNKPKVKTQKQESIMADPSDHKFDPFGSSDALHRSVRHTDISHNPKMSQHHAESSFTGENRSLRLDKSASAGNLLQRGSQPSEPTHNAHDRHFSEVSKTTEDYRRHRQTSESSNTGEILRRSMRNPDPVNVVVSREEMFGKEFLSNTGGLGPKSLVGRELSSTVDRSQRSTLVRDSQVNTGSCPINNPPQAASSLLTDMKTLVINGNVYILLRVIGKGGSSKVYQGIAPNCKICAVKCVSFSEAEESMVASYRNEIRLLQQLQNSEEVVKLYDYMFDEAANMLYVVMECGEMDLQTFFRIKESQTRILRMFVRPYWIQMLHAVQVLHKQGIVHSDLKPANFIVVCGQLKLIDFGIAKTVMPDCTSVVCDEIVGTFNYMSPEAVTDLNGGRDLTGESKPNIKISTRSDVWSLGCILYYLVFSHTPFEHIRNPLMKLQAIMNPNYRIEYPPTTIPHVVDVMKKCLERNSKNRPTIEELLEHPYVTSD